MPKLDIHGIKHLNNSKNVEIPSCQNWHGGSVISSPKIKLIKAPGILSSFVWPRFFGGRSVVANF
jgi:hypothetical protein